MYVFRENPIQYNRSLKLYKTDSLAVLFFCKWQNFRKLVQPTDTDRTGVSSLMSHLTHETLSLR